MGTNSQQLEETILEDAEKKKKPVLRRAKRKADKILQKAREEAEEQREAMKREAAERAQQETARIMARTELDAQNIRREARETILDSIRQQAEEDLRQFTTSDDYPDALAQLVVISVQDMTGEAFEIVLRREDREKRAGEILDAARQKLRDAFQDEMTLEVAEETTSALGGLIVRRTDQSQRCDQRFDSRMDRFWGELRIHVNDLVAAELGRLETGNQQDIFNTMQDTTDE